MTMVARNFYEVNNNIFYPRLDIDGEKTGVTGMEFPVFNYAIYLLSLVFGYEHWYGRLINLLITSIGIYFFYKTIKKYFDEELAFFFRDYTPVLTLVSCCAENNAGYMQLLFDDHRCLLWCNLF